MKVLCFAGNIFNYLCGCIYGTLSIGSLVYGITGFFLINGWFRKIAPESSLATVVVVNFDKHGFAVSLFVTFLVVIMWGGYERTKYKRWGL